MRFAATAVTVEARRVIRLSDGDTGAFSDLLPDLGGTVWKLSLAPAGATAGIDAGTVAGAGTYRESGVRAEAPIAPAPILEADAVAELDENPWFRGRLLIPFNDRIPGGRYRFRGREYQLAMNDPGSASALHGLVYNQPFTVHDLKGLDTEASVSLSYGIRSDVFEGYPFPLGVTAIYRLTPKAFELSIVLRNSGPDGAPVTFGWHPYIHAPDGVDSVRLYCPAGRYVEVDRNLLPTGNLPRTAEGPFDFSLSQGLGGRELDIALERTFQRPVARTLVDRGIDLIELEQSVPPFGYTQLFVPPGRSSIAVEPVTGATDAFNRPELGLRMLEPGEAVRGRTRIRRTVRVEEL
jgi:aldose 1-epimerase